MSGLLLAVVAGFALAPAAAWVARLRWSGWLIALLPAVLTIYFASLIPRVVAGERVSERLSWMPSLGLEASFAVDGLGLLFALLICGIGTLVFIYGGGYLAGDRQLGRFYAALLVFMASMLGIVVADNLLLLYVFWAGTSFSSYILIGYYHERQAARGSAQQALLVTVAGELAMLGGFVLLGFVAGTFEISALLGRGDAIRTDPLYLPILALILVGALTKSAQFPFHFWLPNAMAAPAPVSAYLHSATMVKAGVFLMARLLPVLGGTEAWTITLVGAGAVTLLLGSLLALRGSEVKRVLAYSTVAALGMITMLLGIGSTEAVTAAIVFLVGHALYKGTLFLFAGIADHEAGATETAALAGLWRRMPLASAAAVLAALSMAGLLPFFGFIGKELVFESLFHVGGVLGVALLALAVLANALLVVVAVRVGVRPLMRGPEQARHEAPPSLLAGPLLLAGLGVTTGLVPGLLATPLVSAAVAGTTQLPTNIELVLWHGINVILAFSGITLALGAAIYWWRASARRWTGWLELGSRLGPEQGYGSAVDLVQRGALGLTRRLQTGYLRHYVLVTLAAPVTLVAMALVRAGGIELGAGQPELRPTEVGLGVLILVAAFVAVRSRSRLGAVAALGVAGYGVAIVFLTFGAPDLAMTQVLIETLTVIVFVLVLYHLPRIGSLVQGGGIRDAVVSLAFGGLMTLLVMATLTPGTRDTISSFFLEQSLPAAHGRNVVNVILVDFRALDTLGEIAVLALAGLGVLVLLRIHIEHRAARR
ncbi:MAG TPA: hydrogen gas-evolving membrane-bound hydrogenase subunit E [Candidatus Limnocylindrales bacterium]|nr:hydrogen gas-evolving membrane-bound hydrogenase subunit E [Candidatus Limnocylindrales bacterium]